LVLEHLPLVKAIAVRVHENLRRPCRFWNDLVHAGILGLFDAHQIQIPINRSCFSYAKHVSKAPSLDSLPPARLGLARHAPPPQTRKRPRVSSRRNESAILEAEVRPAPWHGRRPLAHHDLDCATWASSQRPPAPMRMTIYPPRLSGKAESRPDSICAASSSAPASATP